MPELASGALLDAVLAGCEKLIAEYPHSETLARTSARAQRNVAARSFAPMPAPG